MAEPVNDAFGSLVSDTTNVVRSGLENTTGAALDTVGAVAGELKRGVANVAKYTNKYVQFKPRHLVMAGLTAAAAGAAIVAAPGLSVSAAATAGVAVPWGAVAAGTAAVLIAAKYRGGKMYKGRGAKQAGPAAAAPPGRKPPRIQPAAPARSESQVGSRPELHARREK